MHIIQQEQSLDLLLFNELGRYPRNNVPSWVPDWTTTAKFCPIWYPAELYNTSKSRPCHAVLKDGLRLEVRTVKVHTIKEVTGMRANGLVQASGLVSQLMEWRRIAGRRAMFADAVFAREVEHRKSDLKQSEHEKIRRFQPGDVAKILA